MTDHGSPAHDPQLLKGLVGLLLLGVLRDGESYGYEIASTLRERGLHDLKEGTVYPALSRLEKEALVSTKLVQSSAGPARKYYELTEKGRTEFDKTRDSWNALVRTVNGVCAD